MWDKNSWFSQDVARDWWSFFLEKTKDLRNTTPKIPSQCIQVDNLKQQILPRFQHLLFDNDVFMSKLPGDCTDVLALIDHNIGLFLKRRMAEYYWDEFSKTSENVDYFTNEIKAHEWRIWYTIWEGRAWKEFCAHPQSIQNRAKEVGYFNCIRGIQLILPPPSYITPLIFWVSKILKIFYTEFV